MGKVRIKDPDSEPPKDNKKKFEAKGKLITEPKPENASRVIFETKKLSDRPVSVYKERITDADSGSTDWYYWWTTEDSQVIGRDEIVKVNEKLQKEVTIGFDYLIKANPEVKAKLIETKTARTKFYLKDGENRLEVPEKDF